MKKLISVMMAVTLVMALLAGCGASAPAETTAPAVNAPASALELMETVWGSYAEDQKFAVIGGSMAAPVDGAPGSYDIADENITYSLMIPAEQLGNVTEAASMIHMMNANTFTSAAFKLAEGVSAADFGAALQNAVENNQWMCGFPEQLLIQEVGGGAYVVMVFGAADLVEVFKTNLTAAYPETVEMVNESLM